MHYQPSQRYLEPDRLAPPADAVAVTGRAAFVPFAQASSLQNPVRRSPETQQQGRNLFKVNCSMCHGQQGRGDGYVAARFAEATAYSAVTPVDLTGARAQGRA